MGIGRGVMGIGRGVMGIGRGVMGIGRGGMGIGRGGMGIGGMTLVLAVQHSLDNKAYIHTYIRTYICYSFTLFKGCVNVRHVEVGQVDGYLRQITLLQIPSNGLAALQCPQLQIQGRTYITIKFISTMIIQ